MAKYYLVVGDRNHAQFLHDCRSDEIELAEFEAEEALKELHRQGDYTSIVRVVETDTRLVVYATGLPVAYPLLRVEIEKVEIERVSGIPPSLLRPASIEPCDLDIDGDLSPRWTAKATHLTKLAPQLPVGALQQGGGADEFACHSVQGIVGDGLLKIALERRHGFGGLRSPLLGKGGQTSSGFPGTLDLVESTSLLQQLLPRFLVRLAFEFLAALVRYIAQLMKNAALLDHCGSIDPGDGLS